jgi:hypothetical protein
MKINSFCQSEYALLQPLVTMHDKYDTYEYKVRGKERFFSATSRRNKMLLYV